MKPKENRAIDTEKVFSGDVCCTPPHALEPLLPYLPGPAEDIVIWEPACSLELLLVHALGNHGYYCTCSDLLLGQNFFEYEPETWDVLITNPPYSVKYPWIERCFELGKPFALLVPFETLAAKRFQQVALAYYNKPYTIDVLAPERRINFRMPSLGWSGNGSHFPTCWLTWGFNISQNKYANIYECSMRSVRYDENDREI